MLRKFMEKFKNAKAGISTKILNTAASEKMLAYLKSETGKKDVLRAVFAGFFAALVFSFLPFFSSCDAISNDVLRLHVMANSDSPEDQRLKYLVRDEVLTEAAKRYGDTEDFQAANSAVCMGLQSIERVAAKALRDNGCEDQVRVEVTDMYFETRDYEGFSLPAGKYRTLRVVIGSGQGKNWWCMAYPALCVPAAQGENTDIKMRGAKMEDDILGKLPKNQREIIERPDEYQVRFKVLEWYEGLRSFFDK